MFKHFIIILFLLSQTINAKSFDIQQWNQYGVYSEVEATEWLNAGVKPSRILLKFKRYNISPEDIYRWKNVFSEVKTYRVMEQSIDFTPILRSNMNSEQRKNAEENQFLMSHILGWINKGFRNPEIAKTWLSIGMTPSTASNFIVYDFTQSDIEKLLHIFRKDKYSMLNSFESEFIKYMLKNEIDKSKNLKKCINTSCSTLINFVARNIPKNKWKISIDRILDECTEDQCKIISYSYANNPNTKLEILNEAIIYTDLDKKLPDVYFFDSGVPRKYKQSPEQINIIVKSSKKEFIENDGQLYQSTHTVIVD